MSDNVPHNGRNVLKRKSKPFTQDDNNDYEPAPSRSKRLRHGPSQPRVPSNRKFTSKAVISSSEDADADTAHDDTIAETDREDANMDDANMDSQDKDVIDILDSDDER